MWSDEELSIPEGKWEHWTLINYKLHMITLTGIIFVL